MGARKRSPEYEALIARIGQLRQESPEALRRIAEVAVTMRPRFRDLCFAEQRAFLEDDSRFKLLLCTRRSGKSYVDGIDLFETAWDNPGCSCLYVGLTRAEAKKIMCKDILDVLNEQLAIGAVLNKTDLTYTLPNKSVIYIIGIDASEKEMRKAFGQKFKKVIIDEAALYEIDLAAFVYSTIKPSLVDNGGSITLSGMPSNIHRGVFFTLTNGQRSSVPGTWEIDDIGAGVTWKGHRWSAWQNPHILDEWLAEIAKMKAVNADIEETPVFRQEYLGEWAVDPSKLVYRYEQGTNDYDTLPLLDDEGWHYLLGCDLGFNDAVALVLGAWHTNDPNLYLLVADKRSGLDITATAAWIHEVRGIFKIDKMIIDGSNKQAVEEMRKRHNLPGLEAAQKQGKMEMIAVMNGDFRSGRIKLSPDCAPLKREYVELIRDPNSDIPREKDGLDNHCADAALYLYRFNRSWQSRPVVTGPAHGSPEWMKLQEKNMLESMRRNVWKRQRGNVFRNPRR